jgi:hypothetical protein
MARVKTRSRPAQTDTARAQLLPQLSKHAQLATSTTTLVPRPLDSTHWLGAPQPRLALMGHLQLNADWANIALQAQQQMIC